MVDSASSNGTGATDLLDWYEFGVVNALQPLLLGGQAVLTPVLFTAANATAQQTVYVAPGRFPVHVFGDARATVARVDEAGESSVCSRWTGATNARALTSTGSIPRWGTRSGSSPCSVWTTSQTRARVLRTRWSWAQARTPRSPTWWWLTSRRRRRRTRETTSCPTSLRRVGLSVEDGRANPLRRELDFVAKVTFPYDVAKLPTVKGNAEAVVVRASDETASDWRVVPARCSTPPPRKSPSLVDVFSLFSVAARASARAVEPARVRHTGGAPLTLDGVDFRVPPVYNATGSVFCKFGELFTKAEWVSSRDPRGFGDAALCATPAVSRAGFVSVEFYDAGTYQNSASDLRVLFPPRRLSCRASLRAAGRTPARRWWRSPARRSRTSAATGSGTSRAISATLAISAASRPASRCPARWPARRPPRTRSATPRCAWAWRATARTTRAPPPTGTASRWRTPSSRSAGTARRGTPKRIRTRELFGVGAGGAVVDARLGTVRGALARETKCSRSELWWSQRDASPKTARGSTAWPAGAGRKTVAPASSAEPGARLAAFQYVEEEDSFLGGTPSQWASRVTGRCFGHERPRALRGVAVRRRGRAIRRAPGDGGERRRGDVCLSREKTKPRCALGGVAAATELASSELTKVRRAGSFSVFSGKENARRRPRAMYHDEWSCRVRRREGDSRPGFVAVALAPDGADAPAAAEPVASCWFPRRKRRRASSGSSAARTSPRPGRARPARGRAPAPARRRRVVARDERRVRLGERRRLDVRGRRVDVASHENDLQRKKTPTEKNVFGAARFVSSALVACEVPDVFVARDDAFSQSLRRLKRRTCGCARRSPRSASRVSKTKTKTKPERVVARATRGATVSSATGHAFLPAEGGAAVRVCVARCRELRGHTA